MCAYQDNVFLSRAWTPTALIIFHCADWKEQFSICKQNKIVLTRENCFIVLKKIIHPPR